jgi:hypothetical protein
MTETEANELAQKLIETYPERAFEISMPDESGYQAMRTAFAKAGRETAPDGEFFVVRVSAVGMAAPS